MLGILFEMKKMKWDILNRIQLSVKVPRLLFLAVSILLSLAVMLSMVRDQDRQDEVKSAPAAGHAAHQPPLFRLLLFYLF